MPALSRRSRSSLSDFPMVPSRQHLLNRGRLIGPSLGEIGKSMRSGGRHRIIDAAAAVYGPAPRRELPIALQAVQHWVNHALASLDHRAGTHTDRLDDLVAIHIPLLEQLEDQEFRNSIHKTRVCLVPWHQAVSIPRGSRYCKAKSIGVCDRSSATIDPNRPKESRGPQTPTIQIPD